MTKILGSETVGELLVVTCEKNDEIKSDSNMMRMHDGTGSVYETTKFEFEDFTKCFSGGKSITAILKESVPEQFLKQGCSVEFK